MAADQGPTSQFNTLPKLNQGGGGNADNMLQIVSQQPPAPQTVGGGGSGLAFDAPPFEPIQIDPFPMDYSNQMMQAAESPGFNIDYNQQVMRVVALTL